MATERSRSIAKELPSEATLFKWGFGELAFTILPIAIIYSISLLGSHPPSNPLLWREWSFGSIVMYGTALTRLADLKNVLQRDTSEKLSLGIRFFVILLVATVIVLTLVVLHEGGLSVNENALGGAQLFLFVIAATLLLLVQQAVDKFLDASTLSANDVSRREALDFSIYTMAEVCRNIDRLQRIVSNHPAFDRQILLSSQELERDHLHMLIQRAETGLGSVRKCMNVAAG